jgi:signal transduction histidine kinase
MRDGHGHHRAQADEEKLRLYHEQLVALTLELARTEARERRSIAIDLHDTVGQALAVAKIKLALLQRVVPSGIITRDLDEVRSQLDRAIQYTRSLTVEPVHRRSMISDWKRRSKTWRPRYRNGTP